MSFFEALMLICFGLSWPISIYKSLKTKIVVGKSPMYMIIVCIGYLCGILHKIFYSQDWIIILYTINLLMVLFDLYLYYKYHHFTVNYKAPKDAVADYIKRNNL
jgi:type IV secretory pathway TrbD component